MTPDQRRDAIVDAALAVALEKGLASTTVRDVAALMGTSSGLIHHYFDSMDDVLAAAFERVASQDLALTEAAMAERARPARGDRRVPADLHARGQGLVVPVLAGRLGRGRPATGAAGDLASAEPGLAGAARADDRGRRRDRRLPLRGPVRRRVADPVAARRAGAAGRRPRDDRQPRRRHSLDGRRGRRGAGPGAGSAGRRRGVASRLTVRTRCVARSGRSRSASTRPSVVEPWRGRRASTLWRRRPIVIDGSG